VDLETEWHRLRLELDRARDQLRLVQSNAHVADMAADAAMKEQKDELFILEPAYLPTRPDRGRGRVFFAGAIVVVFFAAGYAVLRVLLNDTLLDEGDVLALGGPPALVSLPRLDTPAIALARPAEARPLARTAAPRPAAGRSAGRPEVSGARAKACASLAVRAGDAVIERSSTSRTSRWWVMRRPARARSSCSAAPRRPRSPRCACCAIGSSRSEARRGSWSAW